MGMHKYIFIGLHITAYGMESGVSKTTSMPDIASLALDQEKLGLATSSDATPSTSSRSFCSSSDEVSDDSLSKDPEQARLISPSQFQSDGSSDEMPDASLLGSSEFSITIQDGRKRKKSSSIGSLAALAKLWQGWNNSSHSSLPVLSNPNELLPSSSSSFQISRPRSGYNNLGGPALYRRKSVSSMSAIMIRSLLQNQDEPSPSSCQDSLSCTAAELPPTIKAAIKQWSEEPECAAEGKCFIDLFEASYKKLKISSQKEQYIDKLWQEIDRYKKDPLKWFRMRQSVIDVARKQERALSVSTKLVFTKRNSHIIAMKSITIPYQLKEHYHNILVVGEFHKRVGEEVWSEKFPTIFNMIMKSYDTSPHRMEFVLQILPMMFAKQQKLTRQQQKLSKTQRKYIRFQTTVVATFKRYALIPQNSEIPATRDENMWFRVGTIMFLFQEIPKIDLNVRQKYCDDNIKRLADNEEGDRLLLIISLIANACKGSSSEIQILVKKSVINYITSSFNTRKPGIVKDMVYLLLNAFPFSEWNTEDRKFLKAFHTKFNINTTVLSRFLPNLDEEWLSSLDESDEAENNDDPLPSSSNS